MSILVLCDDYWHPASVVRGGLAPLSERAFDFDWVEDAGDWSPGALADYPLVILSKSNDTSQVDKTPWVTPEIERAFSAYVRGGGGLLALHSGTVYKDADVLRPLLGGAFDHHPPQCPVTVEPKLHHPLTIGVQPFTAQDEHYFMMLDDEEADVFMTTTSEHGTQPGGWTRAEGQGRVCVLTPGHTLEVWLHPSFQALLYNAIQWCQAAGSR